MSYSFILAGVLAQSINTTWASTAEIGGEATEPEDMTWNQSDWAGISRTPSPIGEILDAHEAEVSIPHDGLPIAKIRIGIENPMAIEILSRIRPITSGGLITGATNATPIVITTAAAHGLATGDGVAISGVGGNTGANGSWVITVTDSTHFSLNGSGGNGAYTSGGSWSALPNAAVILLKAYEEGVTVPRFVGDCTSVELVGGEDGKVTLQANFAGPLWRLQYRLAKKKVANTSTLTPAQPHVTWATTPIGTVITELLDNANADLLDVIGIADTGIRMGSVDTLPNVTVGADPPWNYKPLSEAILEMQAAGVSADLIGAFDFLVRPVEPITVSDGGLKIAELDIKAKIGTVRPDVVFEYGDGSLSAKSSRLVMERQNILNRAFVQGADPADDTQTVRSVNTGSQTAYSLFEGLVPLDVGDSALRQAWADANVQVRGDTQLVADMEPAINAPLWGQNPPTDGEYAVGDTVRVRLKILGTEFLDGNMRVLGVTISRDDEGKVTVRPKFISD